MSRFLKICRDFILPVVVGLLIAFAIKQFLFSVVKVDGYSMSPNLHNNERVALLKTAKIKHDSVIVFNANGVDGTKVFTNSNPVYYVKRVIALPGDTVKYTSKGNLYINGKKQSQSYITLKQRTTGTLGPINLTGKGFTLSSLGEQENWPKTYFKVPKNQYFVMGDNRANSNDGRFWGLVPKNKVTGVVKAFPWNAHRSVINNYK